MGQVKVWWVGLKYGGGGGVNVWYGGSMVWGVWYGDYGGQIMLVEVKPSSCLGLLKSNRKVPKSHSTTFTLGRRGYRI